MSGPKAIKLKTADDQAKIWIFNPLLSMEDIKGRGQRKKNVFFRALPELPKPPPPHDPNSGNLVLFFRKSKFKIWKSV